MQKWEPMGRDSGTVESVRSWIWLGCLECKNQWLFKHWNVAAAGVHSSNTQTWEKEEGRKLAWGGRELKKHN